MQDGSSVVTDTARKLLEELLEYSMERMRLFRNGAIATPSKTAFAAQTFALFSHNQFDEIAVAGALGSAIIELDHEKVMAGPGEFDRSALSMRLVRIAYNRMQRRRRSDQKLNAAVERQNQLEFTPERKFQETGIFSCFSAHLSEVIDSALGSLPANEKDIVLRRFQGFTQVAISRELNVSRTAVQRIERRFADILRQMVSE